MEGLSGRDKNENENERGERHKSGIVSVVNYCQLFLQEQELNTNMSGRVT
jgi:hypothetical protein